MSRKAPILLSENVLLPYQTLERDEDISHLPEKSRQRRQKRMQRSYDYVLSYSTFNLT